MTAFILWSALDPMLADRIKLNIRRAPEDEDMMID